MAARAKPSDRPRLGIEFGRRNVLSVRRLTEHGAFLGGPRGQPGGQSSERDELEVLLPQKEVPPGLMVDEPIEVFLYFDSEDRPIATTRTPLAQAGRFACLEVKAVTRMGAFLDWGLDKDLLLPFAAQAYPIREAGRRIVVYVYVDPVSRRMIAATKFNRRLVDPPRDLKPGQPVELLPYEKTELGFNAIVDQSFKGLIHRDDSASEPRIGETVNGFVQRVREDGRVDLALRPSGGRAARAARDVLLDALQAAGGHLDLGDKSSPEAIRSRLGLSKKAFKKALGTLYREESVSMTEESVSLRPGAATRPKR